MSPPKALQRDVERSGMKGGMLKKKDPNAQQEDKQFSSFL
jgi:hypothetical protein